MVDSYLVKVAVLIIVALIYAIFDVSNKRNVPDLFVYATIIVGIVIALLYNYSFIWVDFGIAAIIALVGFAIYRAGFLGLGDVLELVFISLVMPLQPTPAYLSIYQFGIPFVLSVVISAGYTALLFMPLYYLLGKIVFAGKKLAKPDKRSVVLGVMLLAGYVALVAAFTYVSGLNLIAVILILILAFVSFISMIFQRDIYLGMTSMIYPSKLENGDMIAVNLMNASEISYFKSRYGGFGRLVTTQAIKKLSGVKRKLPVYRDSVPFSLFILLGIIISLAVGNLVLVILGF